MSTKVAVTYTGNDDPFVDRIYHSGLTFSNGQTRLVPEVLAARLLRHADVFKKGDDSTAQEAAVAAQAAEPQDDTEQLLADAKAKEDAQGELENKRFDLLQQVERMDKTALRDFAKVTYQQDIHPNTGVDKARDMVRGFIDQFGVL